MRDAAGELSHRFHLLRLPQLFLDRAMVRDIRNDAGHAHRASILEVRLALDVHPAQRMIVRTHDAAFEGQHAGRVRIDECAANGVAVAGHEVVHRRVERPARQSLVGAEDLVAPSGSSRLAQDEVEFPVAHAGGVEGQAQAVLDATTLGHFVLKPGVGRSQLLAPASIVRKIRHDAANDRREFVVDFQVDERDVHRHFAARGLEHELARTRRPLFAADHRFDSSPVVDAEKPADGLPQDSFARPADQPGEALVAVEHGAVGTQRDGALLHLFDQDAVGAVGILERVDELARSGADDDGIDVAVPDRVQRLLGFLEARPGLPIRGEHLEFAGRFRVLVDVDDLEFVKPVQVFTADPAHVLEGARGPRRRTGDEQSQLVRLRIVSVVIAHDGPGAFSRRSSPTSTRSVSDRLPMIRLSGGGKRRTSVGSATI